MDKELRILILEDVLTDAEVEEQELRKAGLVFTSKIVDTREAFLKALDEFFPDIILSDYDLPSFDGLAALRLAKRKRPDMPFILVTAALGEELAIETLKEGATDYVLKDNLKRLVPSVNRALEEAKLITERKRADDMLKQSEERYRLLFNGITEAVYVHEAIPENPGKFLAVNNSACRMLGYTRDEFLQMEVKDIDTPEQSEKIPAILEKLFRDGHAIFETCHVAKDGRRIPVEINVQLFELQGKSMVLSVARDITDRKQSEKELEEYRNQLEELVENRTLDLLKSTEQLDKAMERLKKLSQQLRNLAAYLQSLREEERMLISKEIHDELGHKLAGMKFDLMFLLNNISGSPEEKQFVSEKIHSMSTLIDSVINWARDLITNLRPSILDDMGIEAALEWLVKDSQSRLQIPCRLNFSIQNFNPDNKLAIAIFRICQECLTNISRYAHATSVTINLKETGGNLMLEVLDNGIGITADQIGNPKSFGLIGMRERAIMFGGEFNITGEARKGTRVTVLLPVGN